MSDKAEKFKNIENKLLCYIEQGQNEKIKDIIDTYGNMLKTHIFKNGWNFLQFLCRYGNIDMLKYYEQQVETIDPYGQSYSLLHCACFGCEIQMMKYLIDVKNVDVNYVNDTLKDLTPFRQSLRIGKYDVIDLLLKKGAYIVFDDKQVNNMKIDENGVYRCLKTNKEINQNQIFNAQETTELQIKGLLNWLRYRNFLFLRQISSQFKDVENIDQQFLQVFTEDIKTHKIFKYL